MSEETATTEYVLDPDQDLSEIDEEELAKIIRSYRNLPYVLKIERVDGNNISCRNSWGNHIDYEFKDGNFFIKEDD